MSERVHINPEYNADVEKLKKDIVSAYQDLVDIHTWALNGDHDSVFVHTDLIKVMDALRDQSLVALPEPLKNHGPSTYEKKQIEDVLNRARELVKKI